MLTLLRRLIAWLKVNELFVLILVVLLVAFGLMLIFRPTLAQPGDDIIHYFY